MGLESHESLPRVGKNKQRPGTREELGRLRKDVAGGFLIKTVEAGETIDKGKRAFILACQKALSEMKSDTKYGPYIQAILKLPGRNAPVTEENLIALMVAVAQVEGGPDLGRCVEASYSLYSCYRITITGKDKDPGTQALQALHLNGKGFDKKLKDSKNSSKLFLAFLIEKAKGEVLSHASTQRRVTPQEAATVLDRFLPLNDNRTAFMDFYKGAPSSSYSTDLNRVYLQALKEVPAVLGERKIIDEEPKEVETIEGSQDFYSGKEFEYGVKLWEIPGNRTSFELAVQDANAANNYPVVLDKDLAPLERVLEDCVGPDGLQSGDRLGVGKEGEKVFLVFCRGSDCERIEDPQ